MKHNYLLGVYDDDDTLMNGVVAMRKAGYKMHEVFTPFPVHGLDAAMGLQETRLHTMGFVFGAIGTIFALTAMGLIMAVDWPHIVGGKPYFPLPAFIPITFEVTVLFSAVGMTVVFYLRNGLSIFRDKEVLYKRITDDRFVIAVCRKRYPDAGDVAAMSKIFADTGAVEVTERGLEEELAPNLWKHDEDTAHLETHHH